MVRPYKTSEVAGSSVLHIAVAVVYDDELAATDEISGGVLRTVTVSDDEATVPSMSSATA